MVFRITSTSRLLKNTRRTGKTAGFTLIEMMIAAGIGLVIMAVLGLELYYTSWCMASLGNYADLDRASRSALDTMSREIRQADRVSAFTTNEVQLQYNGGSLIFSYDPSQKTLTRTTSTSSKVLLRECDSLIFAIFQRNPINGQYDQYPAATVDTAKLVQVTWVCSRKILGRSINTESVHSAKFVLRNR
jgi:prepilin-type N-terminal cleavage/methylation domain-containing protein